MLAKTGVEILDRKPAKNKKWKIKKKKKKKIVESYLLTDAVDCQESTFLKLV